ncbi:hypothetical protein [Nonomuraea sp. NPDC005650]|uniref:DUF7824 domain-containing protein n=1 Tax=Nonomuraea sp. NPDC005650 TaxID=3157045 RepID=UPI0033AC660A
MTAWEAVVAAIDTGDPQRVADRVLALGERERREVAALLPGHIAVAERRAEARQLERITRRERESEAAWREHVRRARSVGRTVHERERWEWNTPWNPLWQPGREETWVDPLRVAGAAAIGGAAAVVAWLNRREFQDRWEVSGDTTAILERVLSTRPAAWQEDFATRAAIRLRPAPRRRRRSDETDAIALAMLRRTGVVPPEHDPLVVAWVRRPPAPGDPLLDHLLPRIFEAEGVGAALRGERAEPPAPGTWLAALTELAGQGRRDLLLDGCVRRFLRGGEATDLRFFVRLHELLEPSRDEVSKRAVDYLRLLPAAPGAVAEMALRHLRGLDHLDRAEVAEALRALLFRAERKLVTAGLTWLDAVAPGWPGDLDELAPALGYAFACESADVQGRAVRVAVKHAKRFTPVGAQALRDVIGQLPPQLGETLAAVFGGEAAEEPPEPFTPVPLPAPRYAEAFPDPVTAPVELGPRGGGWEAAELWLAGVVRLHHDDRAGLVTRLSEWRPGARSPERPWPDVWQWAEEIARLILTGASPAQGLPRPGSVSAPHLFLLRRWAEVHSALQDGTLPPYLLAEPTEGTGHVDAAELVARLAGYERRGVEALPADLQQALLRLPREAAPEVVARARRLTSEAGRAAARWMDGGRPEPVTEIGWLGSGRLDLGEYRDDQEAATTRTPDLEPRIRVAPTGLALVDELLAEPGWRRREGQGGLLPWWPYVMPSHREVVALHFVPHLLYGWPAQGPKPAEVYALSLAGGPWGEGMALVLACLLADPSWSKLPVVRARLMVDLAARGDGDAGEIGRQLGLLLRRTWLKPGPVFEALESAAEQGAHEDVWRVMTGFLPVFLPGPEEQPQTRHTQALAFALRAARWAGAREPVPCVAEIAERRASNNFVREARRLHTYLT